MKNKLYLTGIVLMLITILVVNVSALGVTPGRVTLNYEEGLEREVKISIINNDHKEMDVIVLARIKGDLNETIRLSEDSISFSKADDKKDLFYTIKLPEKMSPGLHIGEVVAIEVPKLEENATGVKAMIAVASELYIQVPYPGKYIEGGFYITDTNEGNTAKIVIPVINRGKLGIKDVRAVIDIYTLTNEKVASVESNVISLEALGKGELNAEWDINVGPGDYIAKVSLFYDGESQTYQKSFTIGDQIVNIESIYVNNFQLGEIAKLHIIIENLWNQDLENVYANLFVYNANNEVMADVKSSSENIAKLTKEELLAYWDTAGVQEGEYKAKIRVVYGKGATDKDLRLDVREDSLEVFGVGYAVRPQGGGGINLVTILTILVILMLALNLAWFIFFRRLSRMKISVKNLRKRKK
jgi:hypothetical protein